MIVMAADKGKRGGTGGRTSTYGQSFEVVDRGVERPDIIHRAGMVVGC